MRLPQLGGQAILPPVPDETSGPRFSINADGTSIASVGAAMVPDAPTAPGVFAAALAAVALARSPAPSTTTVTGNTVAVGETANVLPAEEEMLGVDTNILLTTPERNLD